MAGALRRWEDAERHFEAAVAMNARLRARPWLARTRLDYARMLLARGWGGDEQRARALSAAALTECHELGMQCTS